jgi:hypothetical protein
LTGRRVCAFVSRGCARNERRHETRPLDRPPRPLALGQNSASKPWLGHQPPTQIRLS